LLAVGALLGSSGGACRAATLCFIGNPEYSCSPITVSASSTQVNGISSSGRMAGFVQSPGIQAFTATSPTSATLLPGPAGTSATFAYGISDTGSVVGSYTSSSGDHAFIESSGRYTTFDVPFAGAAGTFAYGINAAGSVVGFYTDAAGSGVSYVRSAAGAFSAFQFADQLATYAYHIDDSDVVTGTYVDAGGAIAGFVKNGASFTRYTAPAAGAVSTFVRGANNLGDLVGNYVDALGRSTAFVRLGSAFWTLGFPGASGAVAMGINDQRQVVGYYMNGNTSTGFLALPPAPVPLPVSLPLFLAGLLALLQPLARRLRASSLPGKSDFVSSDLRSCCFAASTSPTS